MVQGSRVKCALGFIQAGDIDTGLGIDPGDTVYQPGDIYRADMREEYDDVKEGRKTIIICSICGAVISNVAIFPLAAAAA